MARSFPVRGFLTCQLARWRVILERQFRTRKPDGRPPSKIADRPLIHTMKTRSPQSGSSEPHAPASYEAAVSELEALIAQIDAGQLPLDQLFNQYQRGAYLLGFCRNRLQTLEQQIQVMDDGALRPWSPDA